MPARKGLYIPYIGANEECMEANRVKEKDNEITCNR
jgi:hypothetical protein